MHDLIVGVMCSFQSYTQTHHPINKLAIDATQEDIDNISHILRVLS